MCNYINIIIYVYMYDYMHPIWMSPITSMLKRHFFWQSCRRNFLQLLHDFQEAVPDSVPSLRSPKPGEAVGAVSRSSSPSGLQGPK